MKLCRFGEMGREKPALIAANGMRRDVSGHARDFDDAFFAAGGVEKLSAWFRANEEKCAVVPGSARWGLVLRGHRRLFALD
jgi:2,4-diketo-3-deoxy-L-fuconate hydrolase